MAKTSNEKLNSKKWFIVSLILWLTAIPIILIVQIIVRFLLNSSGSESSEAIQAITNILSILLGTYGLLGWIPTLLLFINWQSKK